jgi:hypothetical protein
MKQIRGFFVLFLRKGEHLRNSSENKNILRIRKKLKSLDALYMKVAEVTESNSCPERLISSPILEAFKAHWKHSLKEISR